MKKILCFILTALLLLNTTVVYADDIHGGSGGDLDVTPTPTVPVVPQPAIPLQSVDELLFRLVFPEVTGFADSLQTWWDQWFADRWKTDADKQKDYSVSNDGSTVHLHKQFVDDLNQAVQDKVHALDGFYLLEPYGKSPEQYWNEFISHSNFDYPELKKSFFDYVSKCDTFLMIGNDYYTLPSDIYYYLEEDNSSEGPYCLVCYNSSSNKWRSGRYSMELINGQFKHPYHDGDGFALGSVKGIVSLILDGEYTYGLPFKIFYSKDSLQKYLNNGKKRTYAPQLPSTTISIPVKYINNSVSLPDITYNINTTNKTEVEIQNEYNTTLNNYLDDLNKFSDGGGGNNPTPTPSGGGSGDFGDGSTPTPTPPLGDGGSDQDGDGSDGWLKKIYDQLVKLSDSVSQHFEKEETFEDKLSKYLESHDKKLDQIVDAIDKLSQGKEEGEEKCCKYDYTELSDFMTKLWNDSDQKFDQMVELLKENNEYQEKMLSTLNSIKNILLAQTVMDAFKNRSSETANKAKEKFPTSVPWDIALIVNAMDAEPKAPVFELPIKIERLNIDEKITVDISSGEWEKLAKACRYMLSLLFVLFMVNLTRKLFFSKGDD